MTDRRLMIAKVHVAKKQLALTDDSYRDLMRRITGQDSAKDCSDRQLEAMLSEFARIGFKAVASPKSAKPWVRKIFAIWKELAPLLDHASESTLNSFVARQTHSARNPNGIARAEWLDATEATKVIQGLEGWLRRVKAEKVA